MKPNLHLKAAIMEVVENQIRDNDPPETRQTMARLISEGVSKEDAKLYIGQAVCVELWDMMKHHKEFDRGRYLRNLEILPDEPQA